MLGVDKQRVLHRTRSRQLRSSTICAFSRRERLCIYPCAGPRSMNVRFAVFSPAESRRLQRSSPLTRTGTLSTSSPRTVFSARMARRAGSCLGSARCATTATSPAFGSLRAGTPPVGRPKGTSATGSSTWTRSSTFRFPWSHDEDRASDWKGLRFRVTSRRRG